MQTQDDSYVLLNYYGTALQNTRRAHPIDIGVDPDEVELAARERELSLQHGMCNGFMIPTSRYPGCHDLPSADEVRRWGGNLVVFFRTNDPWNVYRAKEAGLPAEAFVEKRVNEVLDLMKALPEGKVWWLFGGEQWNSNHPKLRPEEYEFTNKQEAFQWFREWVTTNKHQAHWRDSKYKENWNPGIPCVFQLLEQKGIDLRDLCMGGGGASGMDAHYQHELGLGTSFVELFSSCPCTQIAIAFCRGAARQYSGRWAIYHPPHMHPAPLYGPENNRAGFTTGIRGGPERRRVGTTIYDAEMHRMGGPTESMLLRCWIVAHFSGNNINYMDGAPYVNWTETKTRELEMTPAGKYAKKFADLILRKRTTRGRTHVPMALMLEHDHGWAHGRSSPARTGRDVTWYKLPFTAGDYMIENFFEAAFPEHSLYQKPRPWKSQMEYGRMLLDGFDMRPYEFKCVTASTWGDGFDVLLDNASLDVLKSYPAVMTLGDIKLDRARLEKLSEYVRAGGILLANAEHIADVPPAERLFGVTFTPDKAEAADAACALCGQTFDEPAYTYRVVKLDGAEARASTQTGARLITVNSVGKGKALLAAPDFLQAYDPDKLAEIPFDRMAYFYGDQKNPEFGKGLRLNADSTALLVPATQMLAIAKDTITHLMDELAPVEIKGDPIQSIVNIAEEGTVIVLVNNEERAWKGKLIMDRPAEEFRIEEWWEESEAPFRSESDKLIVEADVPPFAFRIYSVGRF